MNSLKFTKMHGCGNDYVYIADLKKEIPQESKPDLVRRLSDRHFGIGGDGVIFIRSAAEADFEMEMYNADGSRSQMCGNGIRCVGKYVFDNGLTDRESFTVVSAGSVKHLTVTETVPGEDGKLHATKLRVDMGSPILTPAQIPMRPAETSSPEVKGILAGEQAVDVPVNVQGKEYRLTGVSMGNPHAVIFVDDTDALDLEKIGPDFEHLEIFPERTNTEFVRILDRKNVRMRVWERGTGETLACGTGTCAVTTACVLKGLTEEKITVHVLGGEIEVEWDRAENRIYMTGPAETVFEGEIRL